MDVNEETLRSIIERAVLDTLARCDGNKSDAARRLGISRTRLQRVLARRDRPVRQERAASMSAMMSARDSVENG